MCEIPQNVRERLEHITCETKKVLKDYIGKPIDVDVIESITNRVYPKITVKEIVPSEYHPDVLNVTVLIPIDIIEYTFCVDKNGTVYHETELPDED